MCLASFSKVFFPDLNFIWACACCSRLWQSYREFCELALHTKRKFICAARLTFFVLWPGEEQNVLLFSLFSLGPQEFVRSVLTISVHSFAAFCVVKVHSYSTLDKVFCFSPKNLKPSQLFILGRKKRIRAHFFFFLSLPEKSFGSVSRK